MGVSIIQEIRVIQEDIEDAKFILKHIKDENKHTSENTARLSLKLAKYRLTILIERMSDDK